MVEQLVLPFFVVQTPPRQDFYFRFLLGIEKKFFSKSCLEFQCSHLYVSSFFLSLITKKWIFGKIRHSKSSVLLLTFFTWNCMKKWDLTPLRRYENDRLEISLLWVPLTQKIHFFQKWPFSETSAQKHPLFCALKFQTFFENFSDS